MIKEKYLSMAAQCDIHLQNMIVVRVPVLIITGRQTVYSIEYIIHAMTKLKYYKNVNN